MAFCRRVVVAGFWGMLLVVMMTGQVLAREEGFPPADSRTPSATTPDVGFFKKIYHAAKGLMWSSSATTTSPGAPMSAPTHRRPPAARTQDPVRFLQATRHQEALRMNYSLSILNEDLSIATEPEVYEEGSVIRVEARVRADLVLLPKLFIDKCYATNTPHLSRSGWAYIIVDNQGCLYARDLNASWFRKEDSAIVFTLRVPPFVLASDTGEIYIHCLVTAWSDKLPTTSGKKTCSFDSVSSRWKNVDEPSKTSVCDCCDSHCPVEFYHLAKVKAFPGEGRLSSEVVGPLMVRKEEVPWFEGQCHTMKKLLLVSVAFVSSCILAALFVGALLALATATFRYSRTSKGHRLLKDRPKQPYHAELQVVAEARAISEEIDKESTLDYCKLKSDTPEKE
uniref:ZP domain-containing protein n=1 Tax=Pogona vitticeps TaxID=103695 RepID=A0A6J0UEE7_9SAUR